MGQEITSTVEPPFSCDTQKVVCLSSGLLVDCGNIWHTKFGDCAIVVLLFVFDELNSITGSISLCSFINLCRATSSEDSEEVLLRLVADELYAESESLSLFAGGSGSVSSECWTLKWILKKSGRCDF